MRGARRVQPLRENAGERVPQCRRSIDGAPHFLPPETPRHGCRHPVAVPGPQRRRCQGPPQAVHERSDALDSLKAAEGPACETWERKNAPCRGRSGRHTASLLGADGTAQGAVTASNALCGLTGEESCPGAHDLVWAGATALWPPLEEVQGGQCAWVAHWPSCWSAAISRGCTSGGARGRRERAAIGRDGQHPPMRERRPVDTPTGRAR